MKNPYSRCVKKPYEKHIRDLVLPIFNRSLQEKKGNTMIGVTPIIFFWRPNNYRLQFNYNTKTFKRDTTLKSGVQISNYGTKYTLKDFHETTIMLDTPKKKKQAKITVIYKPKQRFYYEVKCSSLNTIDKRINEKVRNIENKLIYALNSFIMRFGGVADLDTRKWVRFEDDIHGEDFIDKIPRDQIINDTYFKKVYQKGIEFKNPAYIKSYISNRTVEEIAPEIAEAINGLGSLFSQFSERVTPAIENLAVNMGTHVKVMKNIDKGIKAFNKTVKKLDTRLSQKKLGEWL